MMRSVLASRIGILYFIFPCFSTVLCYFDIEDAKVEKKIHTWWYLLYKLFLETKVSNPAKKGRIYSQNSTKIHYIGIVREPKSGELAFPIHKASKRSDFDLFLTNWIIVIYKGALCSWNLYSHFWKLFVIKVTFGWPFRYKGVWIVYFCEKKNAYEKDFNLFNHVGGMPSSKFMC